MHRVSLTGAVTLSSKAQDHASSRLPLFLTRHHRYDNCFANSTTLMVDYYGDDWTSPTRFQTMAKAIDAVNRPMEYYVCQWGVGTDIGRW